MLKVAVITGGHSYDVIGFHELWRSLDGVKAYIQHIDDFASSPQDVRESYDVLVFYHFMQDTPDDEYLVWYAGKPKHVLEQLGTTEQGIVVLHHALLAYRQWPLWDELVGISERGQGFHHGQDLKIEIADSTHPITTGLSDFDLHDETYVVNEPPDDGNTRVLLTTTHPKSMRAIAWTRTYGKARVFAYESGHDALAWQNPAFQTVLMQGLLWAAGEL